MARMPPGWTSQDEEDYQIARGEADGKIHSRARVMASRRGPAEAVESFKRWYSEAGHWVHDDRQKALETWVTRGIEGLRAAPPGARAALAEWVHGDRGGARRTIVLAWVDEEARAVGESRVDLGERPKMELVKVPKAAVWLNDGTAEDLEKAKAHAAKQTEYKTHVFVYPTTEPDPIARAKRDVMAAAPARDAGKVACPTCGKTGSAAQLKKHLSTCRPGHACPKKPTADQGSLFDPPRATSSRPPADRLPTVAQLGSGKLGMHAVKVPSGRWVLRGSVPAHLSYVQTDGSPITEAQAAGIRQAGPGFVSGIRAVTFDTEAEALAATGAPAWDLTAARERLGLATSEAERQWVPPSSGPAPGVAPRGHRWVLSYGSHPRALTVFRTYYTKAEAEAGKRESPRALQTYVTLTKDLGIGPGDIGAVRPIPGSDALEFRAFPGGNRIAADGLTVERASPVAEPARPYSPDLHRKGDPTDLNLVVLSEYFGPNDRIPNQVEAVSAPHLRRCIKAGLVVPEGGRSGGELVLTPRGIEFLAAWRGTNLDWREGWEKRQKRIGAV